MTYLGSQRAFLYCRATAATFGNVNADVLAHYDDSFVRDDFVNIILNNSWPELHRTKTHCDTASLLRSRFSADTSMRGSRRKQRALMAVSVGNMAHPTPRDAPIPALHGLHLTERIT